MPKKKVQHRGKHVEEDPKPEKNPDEEYTTVVDYEENKKYSKRIIESNWAKYENVEIETSEEPVKTENFDFLLQTASSDSSHFQFSSEKLWKDEIRTVPSSSVFNLDLNILSSGLACVPFHERVGLSESEVRLEDKVEFDKAAAKSWEIYNEMIKNGKGNDLESKIIECLKEKLSVESCDEKTEGEQEVKAEAEKGVAESGNKEKIGKSIFSENEENLEDWLDSVLDD